MKDGDRRREAAIRMKDGDRRRETGGRREGGQMTEQLVFDFANGKIVHHPRGIADRYFHIFAGPTEADRVEYVETYLAETAEDERLGIRNGDMPF
jgi:hypothetical protein